jgi:hypothetical protein
MSSVMDDPIHTTWNSRKDEITQDIRNYFNIDNTADNNDLRHETICRITKLFGGEIYDGRITRSRQNLRGMHPELDLYRPGSRDFNRCELREIHASLLRGEVFEWGWLEGVAYWAEEVEW